MLLKNKKNWEHTMIEDAENYSSEMLREFSAEALALHIRGQLNTMRNLKVPVPLATLSVAFNQMTNGSAILKMACKDFEVEYGEWHGTLDKIIAKLSLRNQFGQALRSAAAESKQLDLECKRRGIISPFSKVRVARELPTDREKPEASTQPALSP